MSNKKSYSEKLKDPRWQKKRLQIFERDAWMCFNCGDDQSTLHVHHKVYQPGKEPWEIEDGLLITLCESCHEGETNSMNERLQELNHEIKKKFLSGDVIDLTIAFQRLDLSGYPSYLFTNAILYWFKTPELIEEIMSRYFKRPKDPSDDLPFDDMPF